MSPRHASPDGDIGLVRSLANVMVGPLLYLRQAFADDDDASLRVWVREQKQRTREDRRS